MDHQVISLDLATRFREVVLNGTWIANTNFKDQLVGSNVAIATKKLGTANTIAALTQHIHYYIKGVKQVLKGGALDINDSKSFDFFPNIDQLQWDNILTSFWNDAEEFAFLIEQINADQLQAPFVTEQYGSYQRNLEAMIEHCYYHLGQIVLIKKLLSEEI
ncbi:DUF1572 domain-containing protein [Sphingobacterium sp. SRCM116780]|uniref:DUF1572 domain-containing protein n=1 Tax=Sphingobacterium sp. SRCM116780 TaxID=2907623 RepID=UPI001F18BF96|nr:DUF1572 domain-containing protein [Sphingobacterium sp. SRCM116780]UIR57304.1 DUF1572 domain-containing protein [Sphingobacterium sp. SRCM116780]